jgi:hypothetical protein
MYKDSYSQLQRSPREEAMLIESEEGGFSHVASEMLCSGEGLPSRATESLQLAVERLCLYDESDLFESIQSIHTNSALYSPNQL